MHMHMNILYILYIFHNLISYLYNYTILYNPRGHIYIYMFNLYYVIYISLFHLSHRHVHLAGRRRRLRGVEGDGGEVAGDADAAVSADLDLIHTHTHTHTYTHTTHR
jgi:hypothetical protein